jgi:cytochrome P450
MEDGLDDFLRDFPAHGAERFQQFDFLRARSPITTREGIEVLSYDDVRRVLVSPGWRMPAPAGSVGAGVASVIRMDGAEHERLLPWLQLFVRRAAGRDTRRQVAAETAAVVAAGPWPLDPVALCAVPVKVTGWLLGVALDPARCREWGIAGAQSAAATADRKHDHDGPVEALESLVEVISTNADSSRPDGFAALIRAAVVRAELTLAEARSLLLTLVIAGGQSIHEAVHSLSYVLATQRTGADFSSPAARRALIAETLRLYTPSQFVIREAVVDGQVSGVPAAAGTRARLWLSAANRDPAVFARPHEFQLHRTRRNLAFARGAHWCVAEGLTYAILDEIAATVVNMVGSLAVAGTPSWPDSDLAFSPVGFHLETLSRRSV